MENNFNLYAIYDKVAERYGAPTPHINEAVAIRWFKASVANNSMAEPTDFELYRIGSFNFELGVLVGTPKPEFVLKGEVMTNG